MITYSGHYHCRAANAERRTVGLIMEKLAHLLAAEWQPPRTGESSLGRVRGMLKPEGPVPSERELRDTYTDYLIEKYS